MFSAISSLLTASGGIKAIAEAILKIASMVDRIRKKNNVREEADRREKISNSISNKPVSSFNRMYGKKSNNK